jgi:hypothetical protein
MGIRFEGFDELRRKLKDLERRARSLSGEHHVSFGDLFPSSFMTRHTKYATIQEMIGASPWSVESQEDFASIPDEDWDQFVQESTRFTSWEEMRGKAVEEYAAKKLGFR